MTTVSVYTRAGIELFGDMPEGEAALLVSRWSSSLGKAAEKGTIALNHTHVETGQNTISFVRLAEIAAISYVMEGDANS